MTGTMDASQLRAVAGAIAAGQAVALDPAVAQAALVHGFGWVLLYGGIGVWVLAAASFVVFGVSGPEHKVVPEAGAPDLLG
jgi:hypothetical protein